MRFVAAYLGDDRRNRFRAKPRKTVCHTIMGAKKLNQGTGQEILLPAGGAKRKRGFFVVREDQPVFPALLRARQLHKWKAPGKP